MSEAAPIATKKVKRSRDASNVDAPSNEPSTSSTTLDEVPTEAPSAAEPAVESGEAAEPDVPALSHKEKRLAKKRKLAGIEEAAAAAVTVSTSVGGPSINGTIIGNTPAKSAHGIWVGNMNFATTTRMLMGWFDERGLKDISRINMPNGKRPGENNRGFAYLDFPTAVDVLVAVGLSEQHLDGRKLLIKSSIDYTGRPAATSNVLPTLDASALVEGSSGPNQTLNKTARKIMDRQRNAPGPTLFIGNLGFETKVEDIRNMFDAHQKAQAAWAPVVKGGEKGEEKDEKKDEEVDEDREDDDSDDEESEEDDASEDEQEVDSEGEQGENDSEEEAPKPVEKVKRERKEKVTGPKDLSKANDAGIRKVRLGTFEDTGKCKGWAFVDFHLPAACTRALLNLRNHTLDGRTLVVEYASPDAVRRGAIGTANAVPTGGRGGGRGGMRGGRGGSAGGRGGAASSGKGREWDDGDVAASAKTDYFDDAPAREDKVRGEFGFRPDSARGGRGGRGGDRGGRGGRGAPGGRGKAEGRQKSGAALAGAQRASEAIVESRGTKITFD